MISDHPDLNQPACAPSLWALTSEAVFLNHGSFGSCPKAVLGHQRALQEELERQPVQFMVRELEWRLDQARAALAAFLGAKSEDLVFVPNATAGVNTILRSLRLESGDELLVTDHEYNACRNALEFAAGQVGARVVIAKVPFPLPYPQAIQEAIWRHVTRRTRLVLVDHVSSQTALIFPLAELVSVLRERGVETLVDGAHAPGMVPLDLDGLGAAYYTGNCHKWLCAPKGAGFLHVRGDQQEAIRPLSISHGANSPRTDRSRYLIEFGWTGTWDPSAWLSVAEAIRYLPTLLPGGWPAIMRRNHALTKAARQVVCQALGQPVPCPDNLLGAMASIPIADAPSTETPPSPLYVDPLQEELWRDHRIEVPVIPWPTPPRRLLRLSCQLYNSLPQYRHLAEILKEKLHSA